MDVREIDLKLNGMTCSSCVASIEGALNKMPGVTATVNFATETAHVVAPELVEVTDLIGAVSSVGYQAELLSTANNQFLETPALGWRLVLAIFFAVPTIIISMVMTLHEPVNNLLNSLLDSLNILRPISEPWGWLAIALSVPVVFIAGLPDRKSTRLNSSHSQQSRMPSSA